MTDDFKRDKEIIANATPGPWYSHHCKAGKDTSCWCKVVGINAQPDNEDMDSVIGAGAVNHKNAEFIAEARTRWPIALARIEELEKELKESARLHGMGSEREARQLARIADLEKALQKISTMENKQANHQCGALQAFYAAEALKPTESK